VACVSNPASVRSGPRTTTLGVGILALAVFLLTIPFANLWLARFGMWTMPWLGLVPSAVWIVAIAFVARDLAQITLGRKWAWAAIAAGAGLSLWVASPRLALASGLAFLWSESTDTLVFTPLANRGTTMAFVLGVSISGYAASVVDSALFIRLAFHTFDGWWQFTLAKIFFVLCATPLAWAIRSVAAPRRTAALAAGA
jgi:queuosine precursor transporter